MLLLLSWSCGFLRRPLFLYSVVTSFDTLVGIKFYVLSLCDWELFRWIWLFYWEAAFLKNWCHVLLIHKLCSSQKNHPFNYRLWGSWSLLWWSTPMANLESHSVSLDKSWSTQIEPTQTQGEHANSTQKGIRLNLNPSNCEVIVLTTAPPYHPTIYKIQLNKHLNYHQSHYFLYFT